MNETSLPAGDRAAGALMIAAALLSVGAMAHHPSGAGASGDLARFVHGALIALAMVLLAGFARFTARLGWHSFAGMSGFILYAAGVSGAVMAALVNGFVVPALAARGDVPEAIRALCWELNQAFAHASAYALSGAFVLWGAALVRHKAGRDRLLGAVCLAAGLLPGLALASGAVNLHVAGALLVYSAHWAASAAVGAWLLARRG